MVRHVLEEYGVAIAYDFRKEFGLSVYQVGTWDFTWNEAYTLIAALLRKQDSFLYAEYNKTIPITLTDRLLVGLQNTIVVLTPHKKEDSGKLDKMKITLPKENGQGSRKIRTKEEAEKLLRPEIAKD